MAKLLNPLMSSDATGKFGGMTFARAGSLRTVRRKPQRSAKRSAGLDVARRRMGYVVRSWAGLTGTQRKRWSEWADNNPGDDGFGGLTGLGGYNAFVKLNVRILNAGVSGVVKVTAPIDQVTWTNYGLAATLLSSGGIRLTWLRQGTAGSGSRMEWQVAGPFSSRARLCVDSSWKPKITGLGTLLTCDVTGLTKDMWYWCRIRSVKADGQVTMWLRAQAQSG